MCCASEWYERQRQNLEFDGEQERERRARIARYEAELLVEQQEAQELQESVARDLAYDIAAALTDLEPDVPERVLDIDQNKKLRGRPRTKPRH